jgi:hypothetical protein
VPKELEEAFLEIIKRFAEKKPFKFDLESMITLISEKGFTVTVQREFSASVRDVE